MRCIPAQVSELQVQLQQVSVQADETSRSLHAAADAARCAEAAAREEVKTLELCNEQLLSEKEWTWDTMQAMEVCGRLACMSFLCERLEALMRCCAVMRASEASIIRRIRPRRYCGLRGRTFINEFSEGIN